MDSITSNIVNDSEQETTTLNVAVSASEEGGVSDLAVCHLCGNGYFVSRGCDHHALKEKQPAPPFTLPVKERRCEWCTLSIRSNKLGKKIVCESCLNMLKSKQKVA